MRSILLVSFFVAFSAQIPSNYGQFSSYQPQQYDPTGYRSAQQGTPGQMPQQQLGYPQNVSSGNFQGPMKSPQQYPLQPQVSGAFDQSLFQTQPRPTVVPALNFDATKDAAILRKAMKGFGTDEDAILEVLCRRTNAQRMAIVTAFKTTYGKDLVADIKSECSDNFLNVLLALLTPTYEFYARELHKALSGLTTDEHVLIEVMCGLTNKDIRAVNAMYENLYGMNLEKAFRKDSSGLFSRVMVSLTTANRDESIIIDPNAVRSDVLVLKEDVSKGTSASEFNFMRILSSRSYAHLKMLAQEYEKLTGNALEADIKKEFSGDIEDALVALLRCALDRSTFFAKRMHKAMSGVGTSDRDLIRLVVTRCEIDMADIKEAFQKKYGASVRSFIKGDTSNDYKHALYALIGETRSNANQAG